MKTKRIGIAMAGVLGVLSLATFTPSRSRAPVSNSFSNATLNDRYGFHVIALQSNGQPFAISGYYQFHGDGTLSGKDTVSSSSPDEIHGRAYTGTYQVNPDGTGTLQLNINPSFQPVGYFTIVDGSRSVEIVFAVEGNMNAFALHKQSVP